MPHIQASDSELKIFIFSVCRALLANRQYQLSKERLISSIPENCVLVFGFPGGGRGGEAASADQMQLG